MDRQPVEHRPDKWRGELEGLYIKHDGDIPVTVKVTWTDGTEGEVNAWTGQWTRTHVCVYRAAVPPVLGARLRRQAARRLSGWLVEDEQLQPGLSRYSGGTGRGER
jgi:hypothetical protein